MRQGYIMEIDLYLYKAMFSKAKSELVFLGAVFLAVFVLSGCSTEKGSKSVPYNNSAKYDSAQFDEKPAYEYVPPAKDEGEDSYVYESPSFHGYECTDDCSGHEAGYEWAEENGIDDPGDCGGNSNSFIEGCESYAEEQQGVEYESDYEDSDYYE